MFEGERWKPIDEFPHYLISDHGRVKRDGAVSARKVSLNDRGFPVITLYGQDSKTRYLRQINKLVAEAFLPQSIYQDETAIWHIDGDLNNCRADNLRWALRSQVLEWNEMHRDRRPKFHTPQVRNNETGYIYDNAYECGMAEGELESKIVWRIEKQAMNPYNETAKYSYI